MNDKRNQPGHQEPNGNDPAWTQVRSVYEDALEVRPEERESFLEQHCPDPRLRLEIAELLALDRAAARHFSSLATRVGSLVVDSRHESKRATGRKVRTVGPYRLIEEIGRGGMGVVYLAERSDGAFDQRVALKLLLVGLAGRRGHQRFLAERDILARLCHASIARLLDGGVSSDGRPFIAMEYVDGLPIDLWCDAAGLRVHNRVELFLEVCATIEYAHLNHVVHCDLKPSNVLVTSAAKTRSLGRVKLLDFGIAKLLSDDPEGTIRGDTGRVPLTPAWASPEQLTGQPITIATDVYSLTALLYRLLVGVPPFDFRGRRLDEMCQQVASSKVVHPIKRLEQLHPEQRNGIAACRKSEPESLCSALGGDLSAILLKGLECRPESRYRSPGALAADLREAAGIAALPRDGTSATPNAFA